MDGWIISHVHTQHEPSINHPPPHTPTTQTNNHPPSLTTHPFTHPTTNHPRSLRRYLGWATATASLLLVQPLLALACATLSSSDSGGRRKTTKGGKGKGE